MKLYIDSAHADTIENLSKWGSFSGVTTNPVILSKEGLSVEQAISSITEVQPGDVFIQIEESDPDLLEKEIRRVAELVPSRIMFKIPITSAGLEVMNRLKDERIWTAATALFTLGQAVLAANAGADIIIPFFSRIAETSKDAEGEIRDMVTLCKNRGGRPKVLVASLKNVEQALTVTRLGAWGATIPPYLAEELITNDGTKAVLERFKSAQKHKEE